MPRLVDSREQGGLDGSDSRWRQSSGHRSILSVLIRFGMTKILVIDDDDAFRSNLVTILEKKGFEAIQAATGALGVQMARTHFPDLILCDVHMKGIGGNLTLYALRRDPQIAHIPFVLMSGFLAEGETPAGIERGADAFLTKPFSPEKLLSTIQKCVGQAQPGSVPGEDLESGADSSPGLLQPLNRILEITRLLGAPRPPVQSKEIMDLAGQVHQAAAYLRQRIENCLLYAEVKRLASDWQWLAALPEHGTGMRAVVEPAARQKAVSLERAADLTMNIEETSAAVSADHLLMITQALLDNAFKYSRPGSPVYLQTTADVAQVTLVISDQGCGMSPEQIAQAGAPAPLEQVLLAQHGCGLGLAIARRLIELYRGTFQIYSEPGQGTTVAVGLPKAT